MALPIRRGESHLALFLRLPSARCPTTTHVVQTDSKGASDQNESSIFQRTQWSNVAKAAAGNVSELDCLIRRYSAPMRIFIVATFPLLRNRADELLQEFSEDKILKEGWLRRADKNRGRFRDFLKKSLRNFVLDWIRGQTKEPFDPLENLQHEVSAPEEPAELFDLMWARTVLAEALRQMEADCKNPDAEQPRRTQIWEMFRIRLLDPIFNETEPVPYEQLIERFELKSPMEASNMLLSAKRIFKMHLGRVVAGYAGADRATVAEIEAINSFLQGLEKRG